jgi:VanZ family protein
MNWRLVFWTVFVVAWTASLLTPMEEDPRPEDHPVKRTKFVLGKTLHTAAYTALTVLTGWLPASPRQRLGLLFFLMAHAAVTEQLQLYIPGRTGSCRDVCLDHLGVLVGLLLSWKWWTWGLSGPTPTV